MIPLATSSQRVIPPKMLNRTAVTFSSEVMTSSASTIASAFEPPPASRKLAGLAAGVGDDVERRHAEPGAVAEDADVAVELHVGEAPLLGHPLLRVVVGGVLEAGELLVAEERGVVDRDLGVERDDLAAGGDDQRVDLDQGRVEVVEGPVELRRGSRRRRRRRPRRSRRRPRAGGRRRPRGRSSGSMWQLDERVGVVLGDLLDVHPAHPGEDHERPSSPSGRG